MSVEGDTAIEVGADESGPDTVSRTNGETPSDPAPTTPTKQETPKAQIRKAATEVKGKQVAPNRAKPASKTPQPKHPRKNLSLRPPNKVDSKSTTKKRKNSNSIPLRVNEHSMHNDFFPTKRLDVIDYYSTFSEADEESYDLIFGDEEEEVSHLQELQRRRNSISERKCVCVCWNVDDVKSCMRRVKAFAPSMWVYLVVLAFLCASLGYVLDRSADSMEDQKQAAASKYSWFPNYLIWLTINTLFAMSAAACCRYISTDAEGSGIPEMKAFLSGAELPNFLTLSTMVAKILGLFLALASGLSIGKEGPFVHIASCLATHLFRLPCFRGLASNPALKRQLYAAAVAAGVTMAFGTPVGGVLFSIEVTATYFLVANLWKAFFCAACCVLFLKLLHSFGTVAYFNDTEFERFEIGWELAAYSFLGVICGLISALFIYVSWRFMELKRRKVRPPSTPSYGRRASMSSGSNGRDDAFLAAPSLSYRLSHAQKTLSRHVSALLKHRYYSVLSVVFLTSTVAFAFTPLKYSNRLTINQMFEEEDLSHYRYDEWTKPSILFNLFMFIIVKLLLTALAINLPIACGVLTPVFALGAVLGRFYGELLSGLITDHTFTPGTYAIVGAAALSAGVTRTLSIVIIIFELTGQLNNMVPTLVAVLVSYALSGGLSMSIYDVILNVKGLPYLPNMTRTTHRLSAGDVMTTDLKCLSKRTTYADIIVMLRSSDFFSFPIVSSLEDKTILGTIMRERLVAAVQRRELRFRHRLSEAELHELDNVLDRREQEAAARLGFAPTDGVSGLVVSPRSTFDRRPWTIKLREYVRGLLPSGAFRSSGRRLSADALYQPLSADSNASSRAHSEDEKNPTPDEDAVELVAQPDIDKTVKDDTKGNSLQEVNLDSDAKAPANRDAASSPEPESSPTRLDRSVESEYLRFMDVKFDFARLPSFSVDEAPFCVNRKTPLPRIHYYFAMLGFGQILVTEAGKLVGVVTKKRLYDAPLLSGPEPQTQLRRRGR